MKFLRPLLAIYGSGIVGTFAWLFLALSGSSACASGMGSCRFVVGLTGQLALVWPAYWGGRISGNTAVSPIVPVEVVVIAVLVFLAAAALAQAYISLEGKELGTAAERKQLEAARNKPLIKTSEPNRRNRSGSSRPARRGGPYGRSQSY